MIEPKHIPPIGPEQDAATRERWQDVAASSETAEPGAKARRVLYSDAGKGSVASTLFGGSGTLDRPAWSDTMHGRGAIRLLSRGVAGAAAFAIGGHIASKQLKGYDSVGKLERLRPGNVLQYVARGIDKTIGHSLEFSAYHLTIGDHIKKADAAWNITNFRTKMFSEPHGFELGKVPGQEHRPDRYGVMRPLNGRSLGSEIVNVTFDFFLASIGDATVRNIIQAFDPNVKQPWIIDENGQATVRGKGHFDLGKWGQSLGRSTWRIVTKNAGEDWGAALPYVYMMKWQRQALSRVFPGFKLSSDNNLNGAVCKVSDKGYIGGGYQLAGAIDLHCRFVGYNWFTLMYREGYGAVAHKFEQWRDHGFKIGAPHLSNPITAAVDGLGFTTRYIAKSFIKANLYMQPAVLFFWPMRTPQSKWKGFYVNENAVKAGEMDSLGKADAVLKRSAKITTRADVNPRTGEVNFVGNSLRDMFPRVQFKWDKPRSEAFWNGHKVSEVAAHAHEPSHIYGITDPYHFGTKRNLFDTVLNVFGALSFHTGSGLTNLVDAVTHNKVDWLTNRLEPLKLPQGFKNVAELAKKNPEQLQLMRNEQLLMREKLLHNFADAAWAYTPYMWAKAETAMRVDDRRGVGELGHMDKAIYHFIDSVMTFDGKGIKQSLGDIKKYGLSIEKEVKSREGAAPTAIAGDGTQVPHLEKAEQPTTVVNKSTIEREVPKAANENIHTANDQDAPEHNRRWSDNVRRPGGVPQQAAPTIH